jgi:oligopeptide transport system substrate-binding protein
MKIKKIGLLMVALVVLAVVMAACTPQEVEVTRVVEQEVTRVVTETEVVEGEAVEVTRIVVETEIVTEVVEVPAGDGEMMDHPVTFHGYSTTDIPGLDPAVLEDSVGVTYVENLFVNLTNFDLVTSQVVPEAATSWDISEDGLVYTFDIRNDIPWVYHNPASGETTQVVDEEGNPRFVTAGDFAYGIKRACTPEIGSYYSTVIAPVIVGCSDVLFAEEDATEEMMDAIGVTAVDDGTLVIELEFPAGYFLSMTPMWTLAATPQWTIEEHGNDNWTEAGNIVTNGRYVLNEWIHNVRRTLLRNPLMPEDMRGVGNIEAHITDVVPDTSTGYALWLNNEVDTSGIPPAELDAHLEQFSDETIQIANLSVFYISFRMDKAPFDDVHVRRAFSAAFDRETFNTDVNQGQGLVMTSFAPPGIFGAPPIGSVGLGFDPEFAQAEMEAAGYANCEGFPQVTLLGYSSEFALNWIEFAQAQWQEHLGCSSDQIQIEQLSFSELLSATASDAPNEEAPHMWTLGWGPDYPDENNWVGDVLWCGNPDNRQHRECNEIDDLIVQARVSPDPQERTELYRQIEEMFFGPEGEIPFFPIYVNISFFGVHSWYDYTPALFGGDQWYNYSIDQEAQSAAMGG